MGEITIPLFPLQAVLVPGFPMALHIFESRYRILIEKCIREGRGFGVCLIREGKEVGEAAVPFDVGTVAELSEVEPLKDGRYNITVIGTRRFRIQEVLPPAPYLSARVEMLDEADGEPLAAGVADELRGRAEEYVTLLTASHPIVARDLPGDAGPLSWLLTFLLQVPGREKQALLEEDDPQRRIARLRAMYDREIDVLRQLANADAGYIIRPVDLSRSSPDVSPN